MEPIAWSEDLSVGHQKLDAQHKRLINIINELGSVDADGETLLAALKRLLEYAAHHFRDEEEYIIRAAPHLIEHHFGMHSCFIEKMHDFSQQFLDGDNSTLRQEVYSYLCGWLIEHIRDEDSQYKPR